MQPALVVVRSDAEGSPEEPLKRHYPKHPPRLTALIADVAEKCNVLPEDILSESRSRTHAAARHIVLWAFRGWEPQPSFTEIARLFDCDHTSVRSAVKRIDTEIAKGSTLGKIAELFVLRGAVQ